MSMIDRRGDFSLPAGRVWLNASHQGPLPDVAATAAAEMIRWKQQPHHLITPAPFLEVPARLRAALATVLSAPESEVVLANSASYGLHLVANGLGLGAGDEVVVAANDFPSDILPWLRLRSDGVRVRQVHPAGPVATVDEVRSAMTSRTRVICLTWVHSFSGQVIDLDAIGSLCREAGALFMVNGAQGVGGIPLQVHQHPIDALTGVGFKWLCGPYGTGFCWLGPRIADQVEASKFYWLSSLTADALAVPELDLDALEPPDGARRHDVFGTANFFNFAALAASIGLVLDTGIEKIHAYNQGLAERLIDGIDPRLYELQNRGNPQRLSSILMVRPQQADLDSVADHLAAEGVDVARRRGMLRFAPHFYNTQDDIDRAITALRSVP
ncbi:MAG: aminotransferase class V-fold PLP-dependent enzyme [Actinomycetia bacterium]|nr:aminotransferase class V-fold PLP-dependent enzyme [Actinomycetes bacterium]